MHKFGSLGGRDPACFQPLFLYAAELEHFLEHRDSFLRGIITIQVIAFTEVSAADEHTVDSTLKCKQYMVRRNGTTAHYPDGANVRRVLQTTDPSQVSSGVCSPGA